MESLPGARRTSRTQRWVVTGVVAVLVAIAGSAAGLGGLAYWTFSRAKHSTVGTLDFDTPLRIPPVLDAESGQDGVATFPLEVQPGTTELIDGRDTPTWGVNGTYLGPTLRMKRGERVQVDVTNTLDEDTSMHWHGMHLPAAMDGGPHQPIAPGETWSPHWTVDQPAATLWYHPHLHGSTAEQVYRGVAGMLIVTDDESDALGLPDEYGIDDIPLIIQDKRIDDEGRLDESAPLFSSAGVIGPDLLVNGTHDPHFDVTARFTRLRVLNASNARSYDLGFDDGRSFQMIATDSGLLDAPIALDRVPVSPGERVELLVEMTPGEDAVLRSFGGGVDLDVWNQRFGGGDDTFDVLELRAADQLTDGSGAPAQLVEQHELSASDAVTTRTFEMSGRSINDQKMEMERIDEAVTLDTVEIWEISSGSDQFHNFHVHDVRFRVLDVDGEPPPAHLRGWKDTIALVPGATTRVVLRFTDFADASTPYMYHCHLLAHEDSGMMGQFVVVEPGQVAGAGAHDPGARDHGAHDRHGS